MQAVCLPAQAPLDAAKTEAIHPAFAAPSSCSSAAQVIDKAPVRLRPAGGRAGPPAPPATSRERLLRKLGMARRGRPGAAAREVVIRPPRRRVAPPPLASRPAQPRLAPAGAQRSRPAQPGARSLGPHQGALLGALPGAVPGCPGAPGGLTPPGGQKRKAPELLGAAGLQAAARPVRRTPERPPAPPAKRFPEQAVGRCRSPAGDALPGAAQGVGKVQQVQQVPPARSSGVAGNLLASTTGRREGHRRPGGSTPQHHRTAVLPQPVPVDIEW